MKSPAKIKAYFMEVDSKSKMPLQGYLGYLNNTLEEKQRYVGGIIQCVRLSSEIDIICNDEGKLIGLPVNRLFINYIDKDEGLFAVDVFCGNIMCVRHLGEEFTSIHEEDIEVIKKSLLPVIATNQGLMPIPETLLMEADVHDED